MKSAILLLSILALSGCGDRSATVEGVLLEPGDATWVWAAGGAERQRIDDGAFALDGARGDTLDLRFATDDEEVGWMMRIAASRRAGESPSMGSGSTTTGPSPRPSTSAGEAW